MFSKVSGVGLSSMSGLPLRVSYIDENGKRTPVFTTTRIEGKQIPLANFTYPSSYKRVDSEIAVLMDKKAAKLWQASWTMPGDGSGGDDINALLDSPSPKEVGIQDPMVPRLMPAAEMAIRPIRLLTATAKERRQRWQRQQRRQAANNGDWGKAVLATGLLVC